MTSSKKETKQEFTTFILYTTAHGDGTFTCRKEWKRTTDCHWGDRCNKIEQCGYRHPSDGNRPGRSETYEVDRRYTKACKYARIGCKNQGCQFAHSVDQWNTS